MTRINYRMALYPSSPISRANTTGFLIALSLHIFLISSVVLIFRTPAQRSMEITFLGAILDPFEVERVSDQKIFTRAMSVPIPLSSENQRSGQLMTAIHKPSLTQGIKKNSKTTNKIPAIAVSDTPSEPAVRPMENPNNQPLFQYQHLKLPL